MAILRLDFPHDINVSVQLDDLVYFVPTVPIGSPGVNGNWEATTTPHDTAPRENVILIGPVLQFVPWNGTITTIFADYNDNIAQIHGMPLVTDFIMFSKDNKVNLSSLLGYYSKVQFRNNSLEEAELFAIGADFVESSK